MRVVPVFRAIFATAGRPVLLRAMALGCASLILEAIIFAPNGMRPPDFVRLLHESLGMRAAIWSAWILVATPVVALAFDAPGTRTVRSTRPAHAPIVLALTLVFVVVQLPYALLFWRGGGAVCGVHAAFLAVAIECALAARRRSRALLHLAAGLVLLFVDAPQFTWPLAGALALIATSSAWNTGLEPRRDPSRWTRPAPVVLLLAWVYVLRMVRAGRARLAAAFFTSLVGGAALSLSLRNDPSERPIHRALVLMSLPLAMAAALLAGPAIETEARLTILLRTARVRPRTLLAAVALSIAMPTSAFGATAGSIAGASHARAVATWALPVSFAVAALARKRPRPATFVVGVIAIATLAMVAAC